MTSLNDKTNTDLIFPEFDDIKVSTKTFIIVSNLSIDIDKLFDYLPTTEYILIPKRRGRKKKIEQEDPNKDIKSGSIVTLEYQDKLRGIDIKKKKKRVKDQKDVKKKKGSYFRNSVTVVTIIEGKKINYKISRNGIFQMTGCRYDDHAKKAVKFFWSYIHDQKDIYKIVDNKKEPSDTTPLKILVVPAMRNIDFPLNFFIDREKLDEYFNTHTPYHSLLETSFGYTGVNIKIPLKNKIEELNLDMIQYINGIWTDTVLVPFSDYLDMLSEKDRNKKIKKIRHNTFLCFHSGKIIFSGLEAGFMRGTYYEFLNIIRDCYDIIRERLH